MRGHGSRADRGEGGESSRPCKSDHHLLEVTLGILCSSVTCEMKEGRRGIVQRSFVQRTQPKTFYRVCFEVACCRCRAVQSKWCLSFPLFCTYYAGKGGKNRRVSRVAFVNGSRVGLLVRPVRREEVGAVTHLTRRVCASDQWSSIAKLTPSWGRLDTEKKKAQG